MSSGEATVRVVVVSWNTRELLAACLASLEPDREAGLCEIVVVDNDSTDGSAAMVTERFAGRHARRGRRQPRLRRRGQPRRADRSGRPAVARRRQRRRRGRAGRDRGAARTRRSRPADSARSVPRLIAPDGSTQHSVHRFPDLWLSVAAISGAGRLPWLGDRLLIEGRWNPERARDVPWAHGAFMLFRRSAFDAVGGFDERQWMYAEDIDIAWRLAEAGMGIGYEPAARVRHAGSAAAVQAFGDERSARHIRAVYAWMARRRGLARARAFALVNTIGSAFRWALAQPGRLAGFSGSANRVSMFRSYVKLHLQGFAPADRLLAGGERGPANDSESDGNDR